VPTTTYRRHTDLDIEVAGRETVVLRRGRDEVHLLNTTAARILALADGRAAGAIADALGREHPQADRARVAADVARCLDELSRKGLIESVAVPAPAGRSAITTARSPTR